MVSVAAVLVTWLNEIIYITSPPKHSHEIIRGVHACTTRSANTLNDL